MWDSQDNSFYNNTIQIMTITRQQRKIKSLFFTNWYNWRRNNNESTNDIDKNKAYLLAVCKTTRLRAIVDWRIETTRICPNGTRTSAEFWPRWELQGAREEETMWQCKESMSEKAFHKIFVRRLGCNPCSSAAGTCVPIDEVNRQLLAG